MEGRRDKEGEKAVEQKSRKERKKVIKERKIIKNNKEILKQTNKQTNKKPSLLASNWPTQFFWSLGCSQLRGPNPALLRLTSTQAASGPAIQRPQDPQVHTLTFLRSMGVHVGPSVICTLLSACGLKSLPLLGALDLGSLPSTPWWEHQEGRLCGEETGAAAAGNFPKCPPSVFSFLRKSFCSILPLHTRQGLSSHTAHLSS